MSNTKSALRGRPRAKPKDNIVSVGSVTLPRLKRLRISCCRALLDRLVVSTTCSAQRRRGERKKGERARQGEGGRKRERGRRRRGEEEGRQREEKGKKRKRGGKKEEERGRSVLMSRTGVAGGRRREGKERERTS